MTPRLTQTIPDDDIASLASCPFESVQGFPPVRVGFVSGWRWLFRGDFANEFVPRSPVSPFDLELENILEDHGVSWQTVDEMFALDLET